MNKRFAFIFVVGLLLIGTIFSIRFLSSKKGEVSIVNKSSERVAHGEIEVCNQKFSFGNIGVNEKKQITYKVKSDSDYKISLEFESGKKVENRLGYVTNGIDFNDTLIVNGTGIVLEKER